jgi:hypothetical protein
MKLKEAVQAQKIYFEHYSTSLRTAFERYTLPEYKCHQEFESSCRPAGLLFAMVWTILLSQPSFADEGRYQDYVVGARAMGLGGAFAAISDDSSGIFYNPAGIVDVRKGSLSISTSLYGFEFSGVSLSDSSAMQRRLNSGVSSADILIIPSATGGVRGLGKPLENGNYKHAIAFGTMVPHYTSRYFETEEIDGATNLLSRFRSSVYDRMLHAGVGYAFRAGPWFRLGASVHYVLRSLNSEEALISRDEQNFERFQVAESQLRARTHSTRAAFGFKFHPGPRWSFGASLTTPSVGIWRDVSFLASEVASNPDDADLGPPAMTLLRYESEGPDLTSHLPGKVRVGVAFMEPANFTLTADLIAYGPSEYNIVSSEILEEPGAGARLNQVPLPLRIQRNPALNGCIGIEKLVTSRMSMSLGVFTNFTSANPLEYTVDGDTKRLTSTSTRLSNVHMAGASVSLGFFNDNSLSRIGITGSGGVGETVVPDAPELRLGNDGSSLKVIDAAESFVYIFWSSTFRYGEGRRRRGLSF